MNADFEALKARFQKKLDNAGKKQNFNSDIYPFWNMNVGEEVQFRIQQDSDPDNENIFYIEKCEHTLAVNGKDRNIACIEKHFGEKCPICELSRKYYSAKDKETGLYYYNKKRYLLKAVVIKDPLPADAETKETAENKSKVFRLNKKLIDKIMLQTATELDAAPWDFVNGYNFSIKKMKGDGGNADYLIGSGFVRKSTVIDQEIIDGLEPVNLKSLLPTNPTLEKVQRLLNSHLTGDEEDGDGSGEEDNSYEPAVTSPTTTAKSETATTVVTEEPKPVTATVVETPKEPEEKPSVLDEDEDAIFNRILARKQAAAAKA